MDWLFWGIIFAAFVVAIAAFCVKIARNASALLEPEEGRYSEVLAATIGALFLLFGPLIVAMWVTRYMPNGETKEAGYIARQSRHISRRES
jgi:hypothetical protein